jgi:hypothetical protein
MLFIKDLFLFTTQWGHVGNVSAVGEQCTIILSKTERCVNLFTPTPDRVLRCEHLAGRGLVGMH